MIPDTINVRPTSASTVKANASITWVGVADGVKAEVLMYDRLLLEA